MKTFPSNLIHMARQAVQTNDFELARKAALISIPDMMWFSYTTKKPYGTTIPRSKMDEIKQIFKTMKNAWMYQNEAGKQVSVETARRHYLQEGVLKRLDDANYAITFKDGRTCLLCQ